MIQDDAAVHDRLRALHVGAEPPRVRRLIERQTSVAPSGARGRGHEAPLAGPHGLS